MTVHLAIGAAAAIVGLAAASRRAEGSRSVLGPRRFVRGRGWVEHQGLLTAKDAIRAVQQVEADPEKIALYHSGDASIAGQIHKGISPMLGQWVTEVLHGATDDPQFIAQLQEQAEEGGGSALAYLSNVPDWVEIKVARRMGVAFSDVTVEDIQKHGHLSIFFTDVDDREIIRAVNVGEDIFETLDGQRLRFHQTELYQEPDIYTGRGGRTEVPWGVESGDYITASSPMPDYTLTGSSLVAFLRWWHGRERERLGSPSSRAQGAS